MKSIIAWAFSGCCSVMTMLLNSCYSAVIMLNMVILNPSALGNLWREAHNGSAIGLIAYVVFDPSYGYSFFPYTSEHEFPCQFVTKGETILCISCLVGIDSVGYKHTWINQHIEIYLKQILSKIVWVMSLMVFNRLSNVYGISQSLGWFTFIWNLSVLSHGLII